MISREPRECISACCWSHLCLELALAQPFLYYRIVPLSNHPILVVCCENAKRSPCAPAVVAVVLECEQMLGREIEKKVSVQILALQMLEVLYVIFH